MAILQKGIMSNPFIKLRDPQKRKEYLMSLVKDYNDTSKMHSYYDKLFYKYVRGRGLKVNEFTSEIQIGIMQKTRIVPLSIIHHFYIDSMKGTGN